VDTANRLGEFLRARRAAARPEDAGVPQAGRRRVAGLRREEVAVLAGVSGDYYVRLEQGRERHPSVQVVEALSRALDLSDEEAGHLHELARAVPRRRRAARPERAGATLVRMVRGWTATPALVLDRRLTVLAHNDLGGALFDGHRYGRDLARLVFLDPGARAFYPDWDDVAAATAAALRAAAGTDLDEPRLVELVGELSLRSAEFRRLWARHDLRRKGGEAKRFRHPLVGEIVLHYESLAVESAPGQQLVVYQAEPGSPSERALALLGSLTAGPRAHHGARPLSAP
jgi:transcriptional regulator with XRE-family HTH domain